ncbi:hypothetical protein DFQ28_008071 [Apophysomyces sp. BC1034]|nr:hypothetical protein DFQ30_007584 [Apophysomyces sp. BC1015]KAG0175923.1 hypothetical protein DFQ29_006803 [Apophysomyces sp. BC1021]KAG0186288.1 hypothetical protein DFQ28_008071 [Apophysomyces sp. BC1034]
MQLSWRDILCSLWLCAITIQAYPVQPLPDNSQYVINEPEFDVDTVRFAQLLSTHLLFDHLETAFTLLSKKISLHFQEAIQVNVRSLESVESGSSSVDVEILKGQLKGAVGSYIEDKLPAMWNEHASALDKSSLQGFIEYTVHRVCPAGDPLEEDEDEPLYDMIDKPATVSSSCLETNSPAFFASLKRYIGRHIRHTLSDMMYDDLPVLFDTTRNQVYGILAHFNHYVQISSRDVELTLTLGEMDHTWLASPAQLNEILATVAHLSNEDTDGSQTDPVQSIRHFATLARSTL